MIILGHRGASGDYPENTVFGFKKALNMGVDGVELDVHKTKDGQLVVIHDEDMERTFLGKGLIKDYTLEELRELKCRKFEFIENDECRIPTLEEVIKVVKDRAIIINIEVKTDIIHYDGIEKDIIDLVNKYKLKDRVVLSSFNHESLRICKNIDSTIKLGALFGGDTVWEGDIVTYTKSLNVNSINPDKGMVSKELITNAHEKGLEVFVYTVNDPGVMRSFIEYGIDGIFSDTPALMREILSEKELINA